MDTIEQLVAEAKAAEASETYALRALASMDLTSLGLDDTEEKIADLCRKAVTPKGNVAAVCVYDKYVPQCRKALGGSGVRVATVCNFPHGGTDIAAAEAEAKAQVAAGAQEVDVVLPYRAYLGDDRETAVELVRKVKKACGSEARLKVILETGELRDPRVIRDASLDCIAVGADFIKTSTGKVAVGATLEAAAVMLRAIKGVQPGIDRPLGFKPSGGISTVKDAAGYLYLADAIMGEGWATPETFRFGVSSLLGNVLTTLGIDANTDDGSGY
ncbi:deoxyribose-phosphate aldolase [Salidesulfovibrio onnuriiensis]|uniref:deoxyribose-phosphate aldolase n=1 Tax=Salidesulfovibrio onnuriiensis TaxID=2583823 RepID=UPI0011C8DEC0|nr:deoxyribose-phosphate aldolase [Salidesulfovibrio onnuriiensis]